MRRVVGAPDSLLPDELGQQTTATAAESLSRMAPKTKGVSFGDAESSAAIGSSPDSLPTSQLMMEMGGRVNRALSETSTVASRSRQSQVPTMNSAERAAAAEGAVSDYYQRMRSIMRAVSGSADHDAGRVLGDDSYSQSVDDLTSSAPLDAVSMMPPSCWPVVAPAPSLRSSGV